MKLVGFPWSRLEDLPECRLAIRTPCRCVSLHCDLGPSGDLGLQVIQLCLWVFTFWGWSQLTACGQDFQCWACWSTRMGSYSLTELSCSGMFFFLSCESLWTQTHWCWSGVLGLHRSVLLCLSIPSIPVSSTLQWLLYPERPRNSVVQEPQKVG